MNARQSGRYVAHTTYTNVTIELNYSDAEMYRTASGFHSFSLVRTYSRNTIHEYIYRSLYTSNDSDIHIGGAFEIAISVLRALGHEARATLHWRCLDMAILICK